MTAESTLAANPRSSRAILINVHGRLTGSSSVNGFIRALLLHGSIVAAVLLGACLLREEIKPSPPVILLLPDVIAPTVTQSPSVEIKVTIPPKQTTRPVTQSATVDETTEEPPRTIAKPPHSKPGTRSHSTDRPSVPPHPGKTTRIDVAGIRDSLLGPPVPHATTAINRSTSANVRDEYLSHLAAKVKAELDERPDIGAGLVVVVEIHLLADGSITQVRISKSSGSPEFDQAAKEALQKISLPSRPAGLDEFLRIPIRGSDAN